MLTDGEEELEHSDVFQFFNSSNVSIVLKRRAERREMTRVD